MFFHFFLKNYDWTRARNWICFELLLEIVIRFLEFRIKLADLLLSFFLPKTKWSLSCFCHLCWLISYKLLPLFISFQNWLISRFQDFYWYWLWSKLTFACYFFFFAFCFDHSVNFLLPYTFMFISFNQHTKWYWHSDTIFTSFLRFCWVWSF